MIWANNFVTSLWDAFDVSWNWWKYLMIVRYYWNVLVVLIVWNLFTFPFQIAPQKSYFVVSRVTLKNKKEKSLTFKHPIDYIVLNTPCNQHTYNTKYLSNKDNNVVSFPRDPSYPTLLDVNSCNLDVITNSPRRRTVLCSSE